MSGLPASGKTTTAGRLHAVLRGTLIRSCDVYQRLGIRLPDWVAETRGFTEGVEAYDRVRDHAYEEMARLLEETLVMGASLVIVDAVHGELSKREAVYGICLTQGATPVIVLCECDDWRETERRFVARRRREGEPEHEASDLAVYRDIKRRWQHPAADTLPDGRAPTILRVDTLRNRLTAESGGDPSIVTAIRRALAPATR
jgi:predicted kinase